ncbi:MAG: hypothetical protein LBT47_10865 [Deltaproteobacteria bacterium]|jgi:chromosome segregation ATPase|nr:hypothetical protein [Deltaproteobacteria bacterium]
MSQEHYDTQLPPQPLGENSLGIDAPRSDTAFPSTMLMGVFLLIVVALISVTGWKVLVIEHEREYIRMQTALLERDKNSFKQYSEELPQLEKRYEELTVSVTSLEGSQKNLQQTIEKLTQQRQILTEETAQLSGSNAELISRINSLRQELGQAQGELAITSPLVAEAKQELATLQNQEALLRSTVLEQQKQAATLTADIQGLERSSAHAQELLTRLTEETTRLGGNNTELISRINALRQELGQVQSELADTSPLVAAAKQELAALQSQETLLRSTISEQQKQAATLTADIQGLERSSAHAQELLTRLTEDQKSLDSFKKTVDSMATLLQTSVSKADAASNEYVRQTTNVKTATRNIDVEIATMQTRLQTVERHIAALERHAVSFEQILSQGGTSNQTFQGQIQALTAESQRFGIVLQNLETEIKQWTQRSQTPLAKIVEVEEQLQPVADTLINTVSSITAQTITLENQIEIVRIGITNIQSAIDALDQREQSLSTVASELQSSNRLNNENGAALAKLLNQMQQDLDTMSTSIMALQAPQHNTSDNQ